VWNTSSFVILTAAYSIQPYFVYAGQNFSQPHAVRNAAAAPLLCKVYEAPHMATKTSLAAALLITLVAAATADEDAPDWNDCERGCAAHTVSVPFTALAPLSRTPTQRRREPNTPR
jgi:hypothetical protein